ncbi:HMG domain-containing protein 3 [Brienomyrus brachyistius]|uniref:HMG domain-containing protein 3 n=1 Tax=Brienomyrus brachyistius TaxID=42636 RepID=UPI0020B28A95|nr:HMG domain-containing protein 3 [Brienomyrus brachyistius]
MDAAFEEAEVKIITEEVESCYTVMEVSSPKRRRRGRSQGEPADKSKKPRSAYLLYYFDVHQSMQQEYPDLPQSEINKRISESWKRLNVADKGYYLERAKLEKDGIDANSQTVGTSADVPGFRKILPRANYVLLPKGTMAEDRAAGPVEVCVETVDPLGEGLQPLSHEALFSPMALGSEVELSEQCIAIEGLTDETAAALSHSGALQQILSQCSSNGMQDKQPSGFLVKEEPAETGDAYTAVGMEMEERITGTAVVHQVKDDATHLVTIVPSPDLVETKVASAPSSVLMVPVGSTQEPDPKPSFKLSIKYTRRGRGSCHTPGCSFSYVTRHKPPNCPECGQHLGGKWVANAKRGQTKAAALTSKSSARKPTKHPGGSDQPGMTQQPEPVTRLAVTTTASDTDGTQRKEAVMTGNSPMDASSTPQGRNMENEGAVTEPTDPNMNQRQVLKLPAGGSIALMQQATGTKTTAICLKGAPASNVREKTRQKTPGIGPKRPVRAILPAPTQIGSGSRTAFVQWVTVPPEKVKDAALSKLNSKAGKLAAGKVPSLKPNTLKQLGQAVKPLQLEQNHPVPANTSHYIVTDKGLKILSVVSFKQNQTSMLDLGLSTARGRGKCKNPSCDYVYKNRHKPQVCPSCGWELSKKAATKPKLFSGPEPASAVLLDPYRALSPTQKETQRQSTLQLLRGSIQLPESEAELPEAMALIQELNSTQVVLSGSGDECGAVQQSGWPRFYESAARDCALCSFPLFKGGQGSVAGQEDCWLLTDSHLQTATIQLKICLNPQCLALHSFCDIHPGLFNVGNKLLVSLDLLFKIRSQIRLGHDPSEAALMILNGVQNQPVHTLSPSEVSHIQELLCSGYWAFESLTPRDYNDMICGVCGIAPKVEIAQRNSNNVLHLKNVEFTWPDFQAADEVNVDDFWLTMESEAIEQAAFPSSIPITKFDASIIAPFIPPLMRNSFVINTEKDKNVSDLTPAGDPAVLVRLIHEGTLKPALIQEHSAEELRTLLERSGSPCDPGSSKGQMMGTVCALYAYVQNGLASVPQPPSHLTAGKLYKICPHQVVCGSKYMVRGESARDHVDLLMSSRYWPPVYVTDSARQVALCTDVQYPELASQMWGRNQGCFCDPLGDPEYVSCAELQDQHYGLDLPGVETPQVHPVTRSQSRWIVHPGQVGAESPVPRHYSMELCQELEPYGSLVASLQEAGPEGGSVRNKPLAFDNAAYYYLYNRLIDFLTSKDIVNQQINEVLQGCQPGEVVIRDALYRLGVAQINTEAEAGAELEEEAGLP